MSLRGKRRLLQKGGHQGRRGAADVSSGSVKSLKTGADMDALVVEAASGEASGWELRPLGITSELSGSIAEEL